MEIGNLPEKEFRIIIVKMIQDPGKTMEKMQEMFTKDLEELKNKETDEQYTRGMKSRITKVEEQISDLEDRMVELTAAKWNIGKRWGVGNEDSLRDPWDNIKCTNIHIIGVPEGEERKDLRKYLKR